MSRPAGFYPDPNEAGVLRWWDGSVWTSRFKRAPASPETVELQSEYERLRAEVVEMRDVVLLQEVGIYQYSHPLDSAAEYKEKLRSIELEIRAVIKAGRSVTGTKKWAINGSEKEGAKMVADFGKLMLRAYNSEADNVVRTVKPYTVSSSIARLEKMRQSIAKLGTSMKIEITDEYHALRVQEINLTADYVNKLAEEREQEREQRIRLKEEEKARAELERAQASLEKERTHYATVLETVRNNGDAAAVAEIEAKLTNVEQALEGVVTRAANVRAGYVYVISNVGSFGERVVKIGMTRRLEPLDRVRELGDASVPFRFDVHAIIFSDDAVGLEGDLHREFAAHRVNHVNMHREYFYISPLDVKAALIRLKGSLLSFVEEPEALEWHQSETIRRTRS